jgi:hypothetical protein
MRKPLLIAGVLLLTAIIALSCKKKTEGYVCEAGPTGETNLVVYAVHGTDTLRNFANHQVSAMIKYGDSTSPGTHPSNYDAVYIGEDGEDHIHIPHLNCGTYFIYRTAYDSLTNTEYQGGIGVTFYQITGERPIYINVN